MAYIVRMGFPTDRHVREDSLVEHSLDLIDGLSDLLLVLGIVDRIVLAVESVQVLNGRVGFFFVLVGSARVARRPWP